MISPDPRIQPQLTVESNGGFATAAEKLGLWSSPSPQLD
jgi:hypothetical protein